MASVQELIAAQQAEKSPLIRLLEGVAGGVNQGQNEFYNNAFKLVETQRRQQEMALAQAAEERKAAQRAKVAADEAAIKQNLNAVGGRPNPVMPVQKITKIVDEEGNTKTSYSTDDNLESRLTGAVDNGLPLSEAYAMKNRAGGGFAVKPPPGYRYTSDGNLEVIPGGPSDPNSKPNKGMTPDAAGRFSMVSQAVGDIDEVKKLIFNPDGTVNRARLASANLFPGGVPFTKGRDINSMIENAVAAKLRAETGAAATPSEIEGVARRFRFSMNDSDETITNKLERLRENLSATANIVDPSGMQSGTSSTTTGGRKIGRFNVEVH